MAFRFFRWVKLATSLAKKVCAVVDCDANTTRWANFVLANGGDHHQKMRKCKYEHLRGSVEAAGNFWPEPSGKWRAPVDLALASWTNRAGSKSLAGAKKRTLAAEQGAPDAAQHRNLIHCSFCGFDTYLSIPLYFFIWTPGCWWGVIYHHVDMAWLNRTDPISRFLLAHWYHGFLP